MRSALIIIDRPFRGFAERQFADAVHLARVCGLQFDTVTILLTGEGALLPHAPVQDQPDRPDPAHAWLHPSVNALQAAASGIRLLVDLEATAAFGLPDPAPPYLTANRVEIVDALTTHDHVLYA